jgi:membrane protein
VNLAAGSREKRADGKIRPDDSRDAKFLEIRPKEFLRLIKDAGVNWSSDGAASMCAAIAFYTIFSIAPLLIITLAIAGFFFGADAAQCQVYLQARSRLGDEGATALQGLVQSASRPAEGILATVVGLSFMIFGASGVFAELQGAMDRIWQTPVKDSQSGIWYLLRRRIFTFGVLLAVAFLLLVSLTISAFISALHSLWITRSDELEMAWQAINFAVSFVIITGLFAMLFKLLPRVSVAWGDVIIGAVFTALLFNLGKFLIGLYIGKSGVVSGFGAAGTVIAMVLWVYYSAQIFLLGAEFTWLYAQRFGSWKNNHAT